MEFPTTWATFPAEDFTTAEARAPGNLGMELMVQMRPNGRLLDHFRVVLGGTELLEAVLPLNNLLPSPNLNSWKARYQFWPRDTAIRRNMTTSSWMDVIQLTRSRELASSGSRTRTARPSTPTTRSGSWRRATSPRSSAWQPPSERTGG
jgi:hypothetical protein